MPEDSSPDSSKSDSTGGSAPAAETKAPRKHKEVQEGDASRGEVAIYAFGNVEGAIADRFPETLKSILVVVAHVNPLLIGLVLGLRQLWDGIMDPIIAYWSDNFQSRWGRRRPFILVGGVSRVLFLVLFIALIPLGTQVTPNALMEAQKFVNDGAKEAAANFDTVEKTYWQYPTATPKAQAKMVNILEGNLERGFFVRLLGSLSWLIGKDASQQGFIEQFEGIQQQMATNLPVLQTDLEEREQLLAERQKTEDALKAESAAPESDEMQRATGLVERAQESVSVATDLVEKGRSGYATAIGGEYLTRFILQQPGTLPPEDFESRETVQAASDRAIIAKGLEPFDLFVEPGVAAPQTEPKEFNLLEFITGTTMDFLASLKSGLGFESMQAGWTAFMDPANFEQRNLIIYLIVGYLIFATLSTVNQAPYYALGIELSPSYEGRTQVVVYRSVMNKIVGLIQPWVPVFCFSLLFLNAFDALFWVAVFACVIGIPSTVLMFFKTRERTHATIQKKGQRANIFATAWQIAKEREFLRILFLFIFVGLVNGLFSQIGFYLNVYWVMGSALSGATLGAQVAMLTWIITFVQLPVIKWACDKFQKHRVMTFGIIWMAIGTSLKWWLMDPEHPEYQFVLPFFFAIGISTVYTVLQTMMADVTDLDELKHGVRREGMFGAVMAFLMKSIGTITPIAAGAVLVASGFDPALEYEQNPETILKMRVLYSFVPAVLLFGALVAIWKYPLTRERVREIKQILKGRHAKENPSQQADTDPSV